MQAQNQPATTVYHGTAASDQTPATMYPELLAAYTAAEQRADDLRNEYFTMVASCQCAAFNTAWNAYRMAAEEARAAFDIWYRAASAHIHGGK